MDTALEIDFSIALNAAVDGIEEAQLTLYRLYAAALARVAELEEAARWRPGSSPPDASGWYQVSGYDVGAYSLWYSGDASWHRSAYQGATYRSAAMGTPDFWRPIPPLPPQEAPAP